MLYCDSVIMASESGSNFNVNILYCSSIISFPQVIILDVRVPCTPVATLKNHKACVNGIAWAPHSSCHICSAGKLFILGGGVQLH